MPNTQNIPSKVVKKSPSKVKSRRNWSAPHYQRRLITGIAAAKKTKEGKIIQVTNVFTGKIVNCTCPNQVTSALGIPSSTLDDHLNGHRTFIKDT